MHKKIQYLVAAGLIALTASGTMQLHAEVQNTTQDSAYTANVDADGQASASWSDSDTYEDANGSNDVAGGPTITASQTKFLLNKGETFNLLDSLGLKVVDETDGDITSTVKNIDIPTTSTGSINKKLTVKNSKGVSSELPIQINIIDVPDSINVDSESDLENYEWGTEIGATPAITITAGDLADGKVELTVTDQVNTLNYTVAVNVGADTDNTTGDNTTDTDNPAGEDSDNTTDTDNPAGEDSDSTTDSDTDTDIPTDEDTDTDTDTDTGNMSDKDTDLDTDEDTQVPISSKEDETGNLDDEVTLGEESGSTGETTLASTKTGAVAIGQIGVGLSGLFALAVKRFRK